MWRPRSLTVRERILATVVVLSAFALFASGATAWALQRNRVDRETDATLQRTVVELRNLAETGVDPGTGAAFQETDRLLYTMMRREVPATNEGMIAFIGDEVRYQTQDIGVPLAEDPEFVAAVSDAWQQETVLLGTVETDLREYRFAAIPVSVGDSSPGAMVLAFDRGAQLAGVNDTFRTYALVASASLVLLAVGASVISGRLLQPLRALRETAEQISDTDLSRRIPVHGEDDLSVLANTFNEMLERLETAFQSQRQLLDDAGHELRTPITIVRGHLELLDPTDPAETAATRDLALRELDRMRRLTDDLVLLAKAESPDFVRLRTTSIGELLDEVLDHARRLGDRRWRMKEGVEAVVLLDPQRITQALLQLAANAVKFSDEGSTVWMGSRLSEEELELWVEDRGIGIAAEDQHVIFERFRQVRSVHDSATPGSGLGLSIVAAIAGAHAGRVVVSSKPGVGSRFTMVLPIDGVASDAEDAVDDHPAGRPSWIGEPADDGAGEWRTGT